ncbi:MAG: DDE-type integrase/transposase/recombinase [Rhodocyclaceae bacterium]|nr:DDE-type integrase/transposase/recombinase [Rhodocyclaceae bacterium]
MMATQLAPETRDYLRELARKLDAAPHGGKRRLVEAAAGFLGWSIQTVYGHLKQSAGRNPGRAVRCDKGSTAVPPESLVALGAAQRESVRDNGKQALFTTTARGVLEQNEFQFGCSTGHLNRLLRARKLNVAAQRNANPVQALRAPHPNHTHEVDPSLCLVYYLRGKQHIMRDREFYKNKLEGLAKVKFKVWRYVLYDRASGAIVPWYVEAAGETQHNLFDFLMYAWGQQPGRLLHGVPYYLLWDKGSANTSAAIKELLRSLGVTPLEHEAGNARAKGGVEGGNNITETQFESRLRFEPVEDVAQLNAAAAAWANAWNANLLPGQDSRLHRRGLAEPVARYDLWQWITAEQLRVLPDVEVCRALMAGKIETRQVRPDLTVQYRHPAAERSEFYSLRGLDGICIEDHVTVRPLVYGDCAIQVEVARYDGAPLIYRVEPERGYDRFGQLATAAEIGAEYKAMPDTAIEHAAAAMDAVAYPGLSAEEVKRAREKKAVPFGNTLDAHSHLKEIELPTYLPRAGTGIEAPAHAVAAEPDRLDATSAMLRIVDGLGRNLTPDEHRFFSLRYGQGATEEQVAALIEQLRDPNSGAAARVA